MFSYAYFTLILSCTFPPLFVIFRSLLLLSSKMHFTFYCTPKLNVRQCYTKKLKKNKNSTIGQIRKDIEFGGSQNIGLEV